MTTMTKKDYYCLSALMLIFTILVFFRLGNTYAPQSAYTADENNRDIVLDLGDYLDVSSISIFLGNLDTRHFSISAFNFFINSSFINSPFFPFLGTKKAEIIFQIPAYFFILLNYRFY